MKFAILSTESLLLVGYIIFSSCLNLIALLISLFYRKHLNQPAPRVGFILSIALSIVYAGTLFLNQNSLPGIQVFSSVALIGSGVSSMVCTLNLFLTMRKTRK